MVIHLFSLYGILIVFSLLLVVVWSGLHSVRTLHMLQLDSYLNARLFKWLLARLLIRFFDLRLMLLFSVLGVACLALWLLEVGYGPYLVLTASCCGGIILLRYRNRM